MEIPAGVKGQVEVHLQCTKPDYVVYVPKSMDGSTNDTGNEHFLVFDGPDGSLMAVWTQSTREGEADQRIVFSRSDDEGGTWAAPQLIAGPSQGGGMASWGFPLVSESGRIYVIYNRHIGKNDIFTHTTGLMGGVYSDDNGKTWSEEEIIPMPRSKWDHLDPEMPVNWIVWQKPERLSGGKYFAGYTHWVSAAVRPPKPINVWWAEASVVEFLRFENIDDDPEIENIEISWFMRDDNALQVGLIDNPDVPVVQEPSIVKLPDDRLFCTIRTTTGHPYYTVSEDKGETWANPEPIRYKDNGMEMLHPCSPCPIYQVDEGEYIFLFHNHDGHFGPWSPKEGKYHRRPICVCRGIFKPDADQPVWFSDPALFMDHNGVQLGYGPGRGDLSMYASFTIRNGQRILWYPERKFFLLGKKINLDWFRTLAVSE